jgi:hypothetical protein
MAMVLLASAFDQSRYMRADDLKQTTTLRIKTVTAEMVNDRSGQVQKLVVWFTNHDKGLVLNKTNNRALRGKYGDDTAEWVNKLITLFTIYTEVNGKPVQGLRVGFPPPKQQASGNGQTKTTLEQFAERSPSRPITTPEPNLAPDHDDFDDEIPSEGSEGVSDR